MARKGILQDQAIFLQVQVSDLEMAGETAVRYRAGQHDGFFCDVL
jgi:hypothetical protein